MVINKQQISIFENVIIKSFKEETLCFFENKYSASYLNSMFLNNSLDQISAYFDFAIKIGFRNKKAIVDFIDLHIKYSKMRQKYDDVIISILNYKDMTNKFKIESLLRYIKYNQNPF